MSASGGRIAGSRKRALEDEPGDDDLQKWNLPENPLEAKITDVMVQKYPVAANRTMYKRMGQHATSLICTSIPEKELFKIFALFPNITSLTLDNIKILAYRKQRPRNLRCLAMKQCVIIWKFMRKWSEILTPTLHSLDLDKVSLDGFGGLFSTVRWLSIVNDDIGHLQIFGDETLDYLKIKSNKLDLSFDRSVKHMHIIGPNNLSIELPPKLGHLTLDVEYPPGLLTKLLKSAKYPKNLKELVLSTCPTDVSTLMRFRALEYLKVNCRQDQVEGFQQLYSLPQFRNLEVVLIPTGPSILAALNDDCLLHIMSWLEFNDVISLGLADPRFYNLLGPPIARLKEINFDKKFMKRFPPKEWKHLYETIGRSAKTLSLEGIKRGDAVSMLPSFSNADELILLSTNQFGTDYKYSDKFPGKLKTLRVKDNSYIEPRQQLQKFLQRIDSTLTCIELEDCIFFGELHNIRDAKFRWFFQRRIYSKINNIAFLTQNKEHLQHLTLDIDSEVCLYDEAFSRTLGLLTNLKTLRIKTHGVYLHYESEMVNGPALPSLEEFHISVYSDSNAPLFADIIYQSPKLRKLSIQNETSFESEKFVLDRRVPIAIPNLEELVLITREHISGGALRDLINLKSLKSLKIGCSQIDIGPFLQLIQQLPPELVKLEFSSYVTQVEEERLWRRFLNTPGRSLRLNGRYIQSAI